MSTRASRSTWLLAALFCAPAAQSNSWNFRIFLDDKPIGFQRFDVNRHDRGSDVSISARMEVKMLGLTLYRYTHDAKEQWRDDCLTSLSALTDDNGEQLSLTTEQTTTGIVAIGKSGRVSVGACPMSFAYWNPNILRQTQLLNSQTGEWQRVEIIELGEAKINARGRQVSARRYRIGGLQQPIDLWYSAEGEWLALDAVVAGGRTLRYRLD